MVPHELKFFTACVEYALTAAQKTCPDPEVAEASNDITFSMKQKHFHKVATSLSSVADGFLHALFVYMCFQT